MSLLGCAVVNPEVLVPIAQGHQKDTQPTQTSAWVSLGSHIQVHPGVRVCLCCLISGNPPQREMDLKNQVTKEASATHLGFVQFLKSDLTVGV